MLNSNYVRVCICVRCLQVSKGLSFGLRGPRKKKATYRKREGNEQYTLARFDPVLLDVMEDALAGELNQDEYPYIRWVSSWSLGFLPLFVLCCAGPPVVGQGCSPMLLPVIPMCHTGS